VCSKNFLKKNRLKYRILKEKAMHTAECTTSTELLLCICTVAVIKVKNDIIICFSSKVGILVLFLS
jgi:hypothetical protein